MAAAARVISLAAKPEGPTITTLTIEWRTAYAAAEAADRRLSEVQQAAQKLYPAKPLNERQLGRPLRPHEVAARALWEAQVTAIDASFGLTALDEAACTAFHVAGELAGRILAMRPATTAEAALKYGVVLERAHDGRGGIDEAALLFAFLDDLEHLAKLGRRGS